MFVHRAILGIALAAVPACASRMDHSMVEASAAEGFTHDEARSMLSDGNASRSAPAAAARAGATGGADGDGNGGESPTTESRKRVYIGDFTVLAAQRDAAITRFLAEVERAGGYVESRIDAQVVARVPAERFAATIAMIPSLGRVLSESVRTQDVTSEWIDLDVRIKNAEVARERLLALLQRATEMKDILAIEEQIRRVTTEIEQMKAQFKALESRIAYSRISIQFEGQAPPPVRRPTGSRFSWVNQIGIEPALRRF
ncbi:MAG: DUF4349 domain-containing protein [Planctomycetes bacterium]|nr:DUF4349 domain-containing protein [Planctomycetota bacterium]